MDATLLDQIRYLCRDRAAYEKLKAILVQQERVHQLGWEDRYQKFVLRKVTDAQNLDESELVEGEQTKDKTTGQKYIDESFLTNIIAREKSLAQLADAIQRSPSLDLVLQIAVQVAQKLLQVDRVAIFCCSSGGRSEFVTDAIATGITSLADMPEKQLALSRHIFESTQNEVSNQTVDNIRSSSLSSHIVSVLEHIGISSYAANKIYAGQDVWGVLVAFHGSIYHGWSDSDRTSLSLVASQIGVAIALMNVRQQAQNLNNDLKELQTELNTLQQTVQDLVDRKQSATLSSQSIETSPLSQFDLADIPEQDQEISEETGEGIDEVDEVIKEVNIEESLENKIKQTVEEGTDDNFIEDESEALEELRYEILSVANDPTEDITEVSEELSITGESLIITDFPETVTYDITNDQEIMEEVGNDIVDNVTVEVSERLVTIQEERLEQITDVVAEDFTEEPSNATPIIEPVVLSEVETVNHDSIEEIDTVRDRITDALPDQHSEDQLEEMHSEPQEDQLSAVSESMELVAEPMAIIEPDAEIIPIMLNPVTEDLDNEENLNTSGNIEEVEDIKEVEITENKVENLEDVEVPMETSIEQEEQIYIANLEQQEIQEIIEPIATDVLQMPAPQLATEQIYNDQQHQEHEQEQQVPDDVYIDRAFEQANPLPSQNGLPALFLAEPAKVNQQNASNFEVNIEALENDDDREPAIETQFIETILTIAGNGQKAYEFLIEVIDDYLNETPRLVQAIDKALAINDQAKILQLINSLRTSSDYVGALGVSYQCRQLESAVRANYVVLIYASLSQVAIEVQRATDALRVERSRYAN
ncbi:MAG: GAF domain-containing protein [Pseudanabaenaceae cyanobacterium bins.39]|nr:GAF domain-containing protein [Pseudanabaenaceae cyanobacterium bins.39]